MHCCHLMPATPHCQQTDKNPSIHTQNLRKRASVCAYVCMCMYAHTYYRAFLKKKKYHLLIQSGILQSRCELGLYPAYEIWYIQSLLTMADYVAVRRIVHAWLLHILRDECDDLHCLEWWHVLILCNMGYSCTELCKYVRYCWAKALLYSIILDKNNDFPNLRGFKIKKVHELLRKAVPWE